MKMLTQIFYLQLLYAVSISESILKFIYFIITITVVGLVIHYASRSGKNVIERIVKGLVGGATFVAGVDSGFNLFDRLTGKKGNNGNTGNNSKDGNNGNNVDANKTGNSGNNGSNSSNSKS